MTLPTRFTRSILALAAFVTFAPLAAQAQQYTAANFTVISAAAGSQGAVTCTDSTIMGNVGSSGAQSAVVQTRCSISGQVVAPITPAVIAEVNHSFDVIGNQTCQQQLTGTLAGVILAPGVYCFPAAAALTGTLTLNGPSTGVWVIKVNGSLTGNSFSMVMAGRGKACNVYLESSGATTMTGGTFVGRAFAKKGVTMTDIAVTGCSQ
jgi:hypothetical protein